ncbi:MAG: hypothetical protein U1D35_13875 [Paracoccaceae bacterium]|nr:hypothetical protein [Paracoccaceae bacterium]
MRKPIVAAALFVVVLPFTATLAAAGPIERACLQSNRQAANRAVCGCIQQVADMTLRGADQRKAAKFFTDPDQAQDVRMSKRDTDNDFWARYKNFGDTAEVYCAG